MTTKTDASVTLYQFAQRRHMEILRFVQDWMRHQDAKPEDWPNTMSAGDWDEQFVAFLDTKND